MMINVVLREINQCDERQKHAVREVRNQYSVRKSMYTEHEISPKEHSAWLEKLASDDSQIVFVILVDKVVTGVMSVSEIDRLHGKSDWAFYLDESVRGGLGAALEFTLINFVFDTLGLEKLNCEVIETNEAVVKMHKKFGFSEEGFRRENIVKGGARIGVYLLGITRNDWNHCKGEVHTKYKKIIEKFYVKVEYKHD